MISARQTSLRESLKREDGKVPTKLKDLYGKLADFSYSNAELDFIEKNLENVKEYTDLHKEGRDKNEVKNSGYFSGD